MFTQLPSSLLCHHADLVEELHSRFRSIETQRSFAARFSRRGQRLGETLSEYAADLKRLYDRVYGYRPSAIRDEGLVRGFLDGAL